MKKPYLNSSQRWLIVNLPHLLESKLLKYSIKEAKFWRKFGTPILYTIITIFIIGLLWYIFSNTDFISNPKNIFIYR